MIKLGTLKSLLAQIPFDDADVSAYEGECTGIAINFGDNTWWIEARGNDGIDTAHEGFNGEKVKS